MKKFKIYGFINENLVLITNSENITGAATFQENMGVEEHMKSNLTFRISDTLSNGEPNPFMGLVYPGAKIRVKLENNTSFLTYDFIVKALDSEFHQDLIIYSVSAEDYASVIYAKEGQGLNLEYTGTLKEIIREILLQTRKNLGYRGLNKNYLNFKSYKITNGTVKDSSATFRGATGSILFPRVKDFAATAYTFYTNVLQVPATGVSISLTQLDGNGSIISTSTPPVVLTTPGLVSINFTASSGMAYYRINIVNTGVGSSTLTDFKVNLRIIASIQSKINESLKLSDSFIEDDFKGELGDVSYYKKVTIALNNSNLYNALFEAAKLFDAEIFFDYELNSLNFINKEKFTYKGYRLSPEFNLLQLSRNENFDEFNSAMNVQGDKTNSMFPPIPAEFRSYFQDCIVNDFIGEEHFEEYGIDGYQRVSTNYILPSVTDPKREKLILDFAKAVDKVPNFENILYSLNYYHETGKISDQMLKTFENSVKNDLRKVNIKLNLFATRYLEASALLSSKDSQIDFHSRNVVAEELVIKDIEDLMIDQSIEKGDENWISYINQINVSRERIFEYKQKLLELYGLNYNLNNRYLVTQMVNTGGSTLFTSTGHDFVLGEEVSLIQSGVKNIPLEFSFKDFYYIIEVNTNVFRVSLTKGGRPITVSENDLSKTTGWYFIKEIAIDGLEVEENSGKFRLKKDSYTWLMLNVFGYYNTYLNAINQKLIELEEKINELANKKLENITRIAALDVTINAINNEENPLSIEAQIERDGLQAEVDASLFNIGEYTSDVWNPTIKGMYHHQYEYVNLIAEYLANYTYRNTLVDYTTWKNAIVPNSSIEGYWNQIAGTVVGANQANKDNVNDVMMKLGNIGTSVNTLNAVALSLTSGLQYRSAATLKIPAGSHGTFTTQLFKNGVAVSPASSLSFTLANLGSDRWIVFNHNLNTTGSSAQFFPSETTLTVTALNTAIVTTASDYQIRYTWNGTNPIYIYRPRVERVSSLNPTLSDLYYLYDNPLSINYQPSVAININFIEGLYDLLYNETYPYNVNVAKQEIINFLYRSYEQFLIEGYYNNSDEVNPEGLLEQALIAFKASQYPKIDYGISVIDLSALENYKYLNLNVNDKIKIAENSDRLYKSYQPEDTKYLNIQKIQYDLRNPGSTSLTVAQDDETKKILQYILKGVY